VPEGDTVWLSAKRMHEALAGRVLTRSDLRVPQLAETDLTGRRVLEVVPRGKHMLTRVEGDPPLSLHTHFRMDGSWHLYRPGDRWTGGADWQVRVVLENAEWQAVGYRLPVVELVPTAEEDRVVGHLGPDLLDDAFDEAEAVRRLADGPDREVGMALLDQRLLAGLGNLYRCEVLFLRGLSPWARVRDVADLPALVRTGRRLMRANRGHWEQTTTGSLRRGEDHWVFERTGRPCRRCGTRVVNAEQADPGAPAYARLTYWCPHCQPGPSPAPLRAADRAPRPAGRTRYAP
jgi:endonuclease-8